MNWFKLVVGAFLTFMFNVEDSDSLDCARINQERCYNKKYPICGSNFKTYPNKCYFEKAQCANKNLQKRHSGNCKKHETKVTACYDELGCEMIDESMCGRFKKLKMKCRYTCKECECKDNKNCDDVTPKMCEDMKDVFREDCAETCNICGPGRTKNLSQRR